MKKILRSLASALSEPVMGFLALTALTLAVVPVVFQLKPGTAKFFDLLDWPIVALFGLEYLVRLSLAPSKRAFVRDPWHVLDLFIILAPIVALLPAVTDSLRSSPALRVLRLVRVAFLGARTGQVVARETRMRRAAQARQPLEVRAVVADAPEELRTCAWEEFTRRMADPTEEWFHISGVNQGEVPRISQVLGLPAIVLQGKLAEAAYPRIDAVEGKSVIFAWYPTLKSEPDGGVTIERDGVVAVCSQRNLVTLVAGRNDLPLEAARQLPGVDAAMPFLVRTTYSILKAFLARYQIVVGRLEDEVRRLEVLSADESSPAFLRRGFQLRKELAGVANDLWHLSQAIAALKEGRVPLSGLEERHRLPLGVLGDEAKYMHAMAGNVKETLISVIELHMNAASFQMNKVMKLLAIVTTLALVPTVVGGLLGMNIEGNPWPLELAHVAFGVGAGMALCLYVFAVKGWLR